MTLGEAVAYYAEQAPRGEYVLIVEGAAPECAAILTPEDALLLVLDLVATGVSKKDAVKQISKETGIAKNALYDAVLRADAEE